MTRLMHWKRVEDNRDAFDWFEREIVHKFCLSLLGMFVFPTIVQHVLFRVHHVRCTVWRRTLSLQRQASASDPPFLPAKVYVMYGSLLSYCARTKGSVCVCVRQAMRALRTNVRHTLRAKAKYNRDSDTVEMVCEAVPTRNMMVKPQ